MSDFAYDDHKILASLCDQKLVFAKMIRHIAILATHRGKLVGSTKLPVESLSAFRHMRTFVMHQFFVTMWDVSFVVSFTPFPDGPVLVRYRIKQESPPVDSLTGEYQCDCLGAKRNCSEYPKRVYIAAFAHTGKNNEVRIQACAVRQVHRARHAQEEKDRPEKENNGYTSA